VSRWPRLLLTRGATEAPEGRAEVGRITLDEIEIQCDLVVSLPAGGG
jgi:hypothetical protein